MAHKLVLVGYGYFYVAINDNALAAQPGINMRVHGTVNKIFFLVRYFLDVVHAFVNINLAGAAPANAAAVMLQLNTVLQANV